MGEWKRIRIGDVCTIEKGATGITKALPGDYPLVTTGAERKTSRDYQFDTKAVCIPLVSSTGHGKKTLNYVHYQEGTFALGSILSAVVPRDETILDARYLHVYLQKNKDRVLVPLMKGAANVSLSMTAISNIEVPLPSLVEQKKILDKIDSVSNEHEDFLNELDVQIDLFGKLRQAVLQEAIEGKLTVEWRTQNPELISGDNHASKLLEKIKAEKERLIKEGNTSTKLSARIKKDASRAQSRGKPLAPIADDEKPFELPDGWVWCRLGKVIVYSDNLDIQKYLKPTDRVNYVDIDSIDNQKYLIREIKVKAVSELSSRARRVLRPGYIVYSTVRPYLNNLALIEESRPNFIGSTGFCVFKPLMIDMKLIKCILLSSYIKDLYLEMLKGFNSPSITNNQFESTLIPLPPLTEQQAIVERVDKLMAMIDELEKQVFEHKEQSEMLMQSVLREAFAKG